MSGEHPTEEKDGAAYPWVLDLDGLWHLRPPNDPWVITINAPTAQSPNARTVCGREVQSVHVSGYEPTPAADLDERWCDPCLHATVSGCECGSADPVMSVGSDPNGALAPMCSDCAADTALVAWTSPDVDGEE